MNIGRRAYGESDSENNTQTYYHTDSLGSVLATSKANKSIAARYDYDAWGKELNNTDTSDNPLGYTGHQMDRESENKTGLIYANARYLDPDTGRFLSFDPFEGYDDKPISLHRYMYAYQNPVRYTDPTGNYAELPLEIASIGVGLYSAASNYLDGDTDAALEDLAYVGADIALAVVPGAPGGLGMARQIAKEGAEAVTDAKKLDNVADTASNAKSATKTTKESSTSVNSKVEGSGNGASSSKNTNPDLQKRADAFRDYKESKGLGKSDKVSNDQFKNFKAGNTKGKQVGDSTTAGRGKQIYDPKSQYKDPAIPSGQGTNNPVVAAAAKKGQEKHIERNYGPGYEKEFTLASGKRADAVNLEKMEVVELKPNNPRAIKEGGKQVEAYRKELQDTYGGCWTCRVETYD